MNKLSLILIIIFLNGCGNKQTTYLCTTTDRSSTNQVFITNDEIAVRYNRDENSGPVYKSMKILKETSEKVWARNYDNNLGDYDHIIVKTFYKKSLKFEIYSEIKGSIWFSCEKISEKKISN